MNDPFLRYPAVVEQVGVSRATLERWVRAGTFPRPRRIGPRAVGWPASQVENWKQTQPLATH